MRVLVLDTETNGLPLYGKDNPADAEGQPRMIQFAGISADLGDPTIAPVEVSHIVKPDGWLMDDELAAKMGHGLTHERLLEVGQPVEIALASFVAMHNEAQMLVGANPMFDLKILRGELRRAGRPDMYGERPRFDVLPPCKSICQIPLKKGNGFKNPTLVEAYRKIFGAEMAGKHDALGDCRAVLAVLHYLVSIGKGPVLGMPVEGA